ncbi:hypothetical protein BKA59DRAFT_167083 [Fusarium tricinctum]|uniref:Uncharacterized protein n=1 Tax=Fusarium tricinctum TaxID=61284 RepID=A0A8K0WEK1_9HYPO|nr:hypothetical protein BKA59DRAFT_167083 [Fusarium tricinctum]
MRTAVTTQTSSIALPIRSSRSSKKRRNRAPLSAAQRAALREQLKDVQFLQPDDADNTKINIAGILRKWKIYCEATELGP